LCDLQRVDEFACRSEFGDDHRDSLKHLDLVFGIMAQRTVLDDQHAEHPAAAEDRNAHQRMVDLFAGLRPIGKVGVGLRVGEGERSRSRRYHPDKSLADPQPSPMDRFWSQPLGREKLKDLSRAHHVSRADLGHHLRGDDSDDAVEPLLGAARARHDVAKAAQEAAGSTDAPSGLRHPRAPGLPNKAAADGSVQWHVRSLRAARVASACPTSSSRISAVLCSRVTKPTL